MERQIAYELANEKEFLFKLRENSFEYSPYTLSVIVLGLFWR